jgi:hypothetical protein
MRTALLIAALALVPLAAAAQGGPGVMQDPSSHPEGDGMGWTAPGRRAGLPFQPATPEELARACGADRLQQLVGRRWPQPLAVQPQALRVYAQGQPVTMDMNPARLNIELDRPGGRVVAVRCG